MRARVGHGHAGCAWVHRDQAFHRRQPDLDVACGGVHVAHPQAGVVQRQVGLLRGHVGALADDGRGRVVDSGHVDGGGAADGQRRGGAGVHTVDGGHVQGVGAHVIGIGQVNQARRIGQGGIDGADVAGQGDQAALGIVLDAAGGQAGAHVITHAQAAMLNLERDGDGRSARIRVGDAQAGQGAGGVFGGGQAGGQGVDRARVRLDLDGQRLGAGQLPVGGADLHLIAVDAACVARGLRVGRCDEAKCTGLRIDAEQGAVRATDNAIGELRAVRLVVRGLHGGDLGVELVDQHGGVAGAPIAGDDRGQVGRLHGDVQGLLIQGAMAIHHAHGHLVDVVQVGVLRSLMVHGRCELQLARAAIDGEQRAVRPANDRVDQGLGDIRVGGLDGRGHGIVVEHEQVGHAAPAATHDHRGLVDVEHRHRQGLVVAQGAIAGRHGDHVAAVLVAVLQVLVVRRADKAQGAGVAVDGEARGIGTASDAVGEGGVGIDVVGRHGGHGRGVLVDRDAGRGAAAMAVDDGGRVQGQRQAVDVTGRNANAAAFHQGGRGSNGGVAAGGTHDVQADDVTGRDTGVVVGHLRVGLREADQQSAGGQGGVAHRCGAGDHLQAGDGAVQVDVVSLKQFGHRQVAHLVVQDVVGAGVAIAVREQEGAGRQGDAIDGADSDGAFHQGQAPDTGPAAQAQPAQQAVADGEHLGEGAR
ncbi:hypothetical protein AQB9606_00002 [Aquabacterium sp. CECT 9606]|nr:hypothetical protein AQB9606_00002 [Aquabacterium sp. CECT 9606]